jgi:hypothetical protein
MARGICAIGVVFALVCGAAPAHAVVVDLGASKDNTLYEEDEK